MQAGEFALASTLAATYNAGTLFHPLRMSVMRTLPFALLVFLPFSTAQATPPPQGWEERVQLRDELPGVEKVLNECRDSLSNCEAAAGWLGRRLDQLDGAERRELDKSRRDAQAIRRRIADLEEERARIMRRLGITEEELARIMRRLAMGR